MGGHSPAIPAAAGIAVGILFMFLLIQSVNPVKSFRYSYADLAAEERALLDGLAAKAGQHEPVKLFLKKYPFAAIGIYEYGDLPVYDDAGNEIGLEFRAVFVYGGAKITRIEYDEVRHNNHLISYHNPSLWVTTDRDGNLQWVELRCGVSYADNPIGGVTVFQGYDLVMDFLRANVCWF